MNDFDLEEIERSGHDRKSKYKAEEEWSR